MLFASLEDNLLVWPWVDFLRGQRQGKPVYYWEQPGELVTGFCWHIWGLEWEVKGLRDN